MDFVESPRCGGSRPGETCWSGRVTPDSGPARNRARVGGPVDYVHADVFDWTPPRRFDVCFFSFWL